MHSWNLETKGLIEMINNQDGRIVGNVFNRLSDCLRKPTAPSIYLGDV